MAKYNYSIKGLVVTILAAGEGKRMNSAIPKVLHTFKDIPILVRIINTVIQLAPDRIIVITGRHHDLIIETLRQYIDVDIITFVRQLETLGTGDAIKSCLPCYNKDDNVLIINGDMPLISTEILENFIIHSYESCSIMNILVAKFDNPTGYGRIINNMTDQFVKIVEEKDCSEEERKIQIVNSGLYFFSANILLEYIPKIENNNSQKEYYLTDIVKIVKSDIDIHINTFLIKECDNKYISGVNTPDELFDLEKV